MSGTSRRERFPRRPGLPGKVGLVLGLVALALFVAARRAPATTEIAYGHGVYPVVVSELARASSLLPFSLAEWVFALVVLSVILAAPLGFLRARRAGAGRFRAVAAGATRWLGRVGAWWFWFVVLWGLNFARPAPDVQFGLSRPPEAARGAALAADIGARLDLLRAHVVEDDARVIAAPTDVDGLDDHLRRLQASVLKEAGFATVDQGRVKKFLASPLLLRWGVSGVYGPFTAEPNIVWPAPPALLPVTMAHERAHLSGFAREDAAGFVALLTCWRSDRPEVRYSAWFALHLAFHQSSKERSAGVQRDIQALARFVDAYRGREAATLWTAYGGYLKVHGIKEGVRNYGRTADLALRWLGEHGLPPEPLAAAAPPPARASRP